MYDGTRATLIYTSFHTLYWWSLQSRSTLSPLTARDTCEDMASVVLPVKSCETQQLMSLQDLALGSCFSQARNTGQANIDARHIGDLSLRFNCIMVGGTRFEDEGKSFCWVQQHDSAGLSTIVAEKLDGNQVVHIIREIEKNIVIL